MGERKVLNKYYPPDFDPALIPRGQKPKNGQVVVRVMLPFSIRCKTCGEWIYRGKKFNARKEEAKGEAYLGIRVWRFYLRCTNCMQEITFKTDPKNSNYICEHGAERNFEPWRQHDEANQALEEAKKAEEQDDAIKKLENRTLANRREMAITDALEEIRELNARQANVNYDAVLDRVHNREKPVETEKLDIELEEKEVANIKFGTVTGTKVEAISTHLPDRDDDDDDDDEDRPRTSFFASSATKNNVTPMTDAIGPEKTVHASNLSAPLALASTASATIAATPLAVVAVKRKADGDKDKKKKKHKDGDSKKSTTGGTAASGALSGLLAAYDDDEDD